MFATTLPILLSSLPQLSPSTASSVQGSSWQTRFETTKVSVWNIFQVINLSSFAHDDCSSSRSNKNSPPKPKFVLTLCYSPDCWRLSSPTPNEIYHSFVSVGVDKYLTKIYRANNSVSKQSLNDTTGRVVRVPKWVPIKLLLIQEEEFRRCFHTKQCNTTKKKWKAKPQHKIRKQSRMKARIPRVFPKERRITFLNKPPLS